MTVHTTASLDISSVCVSAVSVWRDISHTASSLSVCSRLRLRTEVIRPGSSSHNSMWDISELAEAHSQLTVGLWARNQRKIISLAHTHTDQHTVRIHTSVFRTVFGCRIRVACFHLTNTSNTFWSTLGISGCVCMRTVKQQVIVERTE